MDRHTMGATVTNEAIVTQQGRGLTNIDRDSMGVTITDGHGPTDTDRNSMGVAAIEGVIICWVQRLFINDRHTMGMTDIDRVRVACIDQTLTHGDRNTMGVTVRASTVIVGTRLVIMSGARQACMHGSSPSLADGAAVGGNDRARLRGVPAPTSLWVKRGMSWIRHALVRHGIWKRAVRVMMRIDRVFISAIPTRTKGSR